MILTDKITAKVNASGDLTTYSRSISGFLAGIYIAVGTLAATTDITITDEASGAPILTITNIAASGWYVPTLPTVDAANAARLYAAGGTAVAAPIPVAGRVKFVLAQGGTATTGTIHLFIQEVR